MKIRAFVLISIIYFFFNSVGLPYGMRYTMFLVPFLFFYLFPKYINFFLVYSLVISSFFIIHYSNGINSYYEYFKSLLLHSTISILVLGFYNKLKNDPISVAYAIEIVTILNFIAVLFSLLTIKISFFSDVIWRNYFLTEFPQLRMLVYEPSYYSFLLVPLFFYFFNAVLYKRSIKNITFVLGILLALLLSKSLGVLAALILSMLIYFIDLDFLKKKRNLYWMTVMGGAGILSLIGVIILFPDNVFFVRIVNFIEGKDISGMARIFDPWFLGLEIVQQKSLTFGIGWGHIKILGHEIISNFYNYGKSLNIRVNLPNSTAEIFVTLGLVGVFAKILIEIYLYRKTKVKGSRFRSFMFWFIFIYQFTGSFSSNLVEYVVWVFAFTKIESFEFGYNSIINFKTKFLK